MCPKEGSDIGASKLIPSLFLPFLAQRPQLKNEQGISNLPGEGGVRVGCKACHAEAETTNGKKSLEALNERISI